MNQNYQITQNLIRRFCFERLKNNQEPLEHFEMLGRVNSAMINGAKKPELLAAAVIYSYLRENNLHGRGGITAKEVAGYFALKPQAVTAKVFDVDGTLYPQKILYDVDENDGSYEFIDKDRFKISQRYYEFLESQDADDFKKSEKILLNLIKKDPFFFDPYTVLHEYYLFEGKGEKAYNLMRKGYKKAMDLIMHNGKFPDSLPWGFIENRHIIRLLFNYAALLWFNDQKNDAKEIFMQLLHSNPMDNIGARYAVMGILEGFDSFGKLEERFSTPEGFWDWEKQDDWFMKSIKKHPSVFGWWLQSVEE